MSVIPEDIRIKTIAMGSEVQKHLYSHYTSGLRLREIASRFSLTEDNNYIDFVTTVGDLILGFYKIEDTVPLLQQELALDPKTAALLGAEVLEFLAPLSDPNWQPPAEVFDDESDEENGLPDDSRPTESAVRRIPLKAPAAPQPLHTYAADLEAARMEAVTPNATSYQNYNTVNSEPVYQPQTPLPSGQLSAVPTYTPAPAVPPPPPPPAPDRPRWSSEI
jgi:hypothetical protein